MTISTGRALIDTSALLALAHPRDQYHQQAVRIARQFVDAGGRWLGTTMVLGELHGLLLHRRGPDVARRVTADLLGDPAFVWIDASTTLVQDAMDAWLYRFRHQRFTLVDAVSFALMKRESLTTAFAFDSHFVTAGFAQLT